MDDSLVEILELCTAIDDSARLVYAALAQDEPNDDLRAFWQAMSAEEKEHLGYWQRLLAMALEGLVPQLFDDPHQIVEELRAALRSVQQLCAEGSTAPEVHRRFLLAYHLEFHALHPAFIPLMAYLEQVSGEPIQQSYERHVTSFFQALEAHAGSTPELAVIAKMIERLWRLTRRLQDEAQSDPLTGLRNRRGFLTALRPLVHLAKRRGEPVGFLWVDVDGLKAVNDSAGHAAG
ncbi:diguanylate cyclase, partial [bacterium]|nr:diguanylate cyclase [bacterium]